MLKHIYKIVIIPDPEMDMDDPQKIKEEVRQALEDSGMTNGCDVDVLLMFSGEEV